MCVYVFLWVSVCVRNMNVKDLIRFDSTLKLYEKLIKVSSIYMYRLKWICILV